MRMNHNPESAWLSGARTADAPGALPHSDARTFQSATSATLSTFTETIKEVQKVGF